MSIKDDRLYLGHILEAIEKIERYIGSADYDGFTSNEIIADAVVRQLEIIGEACTKLSEKFRLKAFEIPFRDIIDMRNMLIHNNAGVNLHIVWETCQKNLPELKLFIEKYLIS
jgi:uncharacterized protein with HEPN domain